LDQDKINRVIEIFFNSLKVENDKPLETGLSHNTTVMMLHQACIELIKQHPDRFTIFVKWFLNASMYLLEEDPDLLEIKESDFIE
jgi:hypothetical protein|tara:strand:+ start:96 stop:350 length:255 start_codon:yes stop_codon:yes gene_type:complete